MSVLNRDRDRGQNSSHFRSATGSQASPQPLRSYKFLNGDPSISRENNTYAHPTSTNEQLPTTTREDDALNPLTRSSRRARTRVDSISSVEPSIAPAVMSQWQQQQKHARNHSSPRNRPQDGSNDQSGSHLRGTSSSQSVMSLTSANAKASGGGLEAWLHSQAVGFNVGAAAAAASSSFGPSSRIRKMNVVDVGEIGSDAGRSTGARSAGYMMNGSSRRKREGRLRSPIPEWDPSALDADAAGLGWFGNSQTGSKLDTVQRWRRDSMAKTDYKDGYDVTDFDSQIAPENRRRRREVGAGSFSAGGTSVLREGVRRSRILQNGGEPSLDALLSSVKDKGEITQFASGQSVSLDRKSRIGLTTSPLKSFMRWLYFGAALPKQSISVEEISQSPPEGELATFATIILLTLLVKWISSLGGWSGKGKSPTFGDFEAQRHWMEITLHLPRSQWYYYDLKYWGLDYPPLTAWISQWCAQLGVLFWPGLASNLALFTSRGNESPSLNFYMRMTVLILDLLIYTPAVLFFLSRKLQGRGRSTKAIATLTILLQPSILLIDYGHFQYNTIMLGLSAASFALLLTSLPNPELSLNPEIKDRDRVRQMMASLSRRISYEYMAAASFFSLSLCFKQMALYYAPAIFAIMLGRCWGLAKIGFERGLACFFGIALMTSLTFAIVFSPWLTSLTDLRQILVRIFPLARGLFEDKVSNIWCFLTVLPIPSQYKLRNLMSIEKLARLSLATTLLAIILPCIQLFSAAVETVRIEMSLDEDMQRQIDVSEKRKREGSVVGSIRASRNRAQSRAAPSEAGTEFASILSGPRGSSMIKNSESRLNGRLEQQTTPAALSSSSSSSPSPAASVLPYALLSTSMAFYLFGFQTHEKSILIPLLPMTLLITTKGDEWGAGAGKTDWEWAILANNVAAFSMWPLLKRDEVALQYITLLLSWNWAIGYRPFQSLKSDRNSVVAWIGAFAHLIMIFLHLAEMTFPLIPSYTTKIIARYPDLFPVLNVLFCTPSFMLLWLWSMKRQLEVGLASGIDIFSVQKNKTKTISKDKLKKL